VRVLAQDAAFQRIALLAVAAGRRKAKAYRNVRRALATTVDEAGITVAADERLSPHSLRHTYTSHLIVGP
jgi:integrase